MYEHNFAPWYDYFKRNSKKTKELKKIERTIINEYFFDSFRTKKNRFIGKFALGYNAFNDVTIKGLTKAYLSALLIKQVAIGKFNILVCSDTNFPKKANYVDQIIQVLNAYGANALAFENNFAVTRQFLSFAAKKIEKLDGIIYLSKFDNLDNFSIEFLDREGNLIKDELFKEVEKIYNKINIFDVKTFVDKPQFFNVNMLLEEYANFVLDFNYNKIGNRILKLGIIGDKTILPFTKKILGWNDIFYEFIDIKKNKNQNFIDKNVFMFHSYDFVIKFSYDYERIYLYEKCNNHFIKKYKLVNSYKLFAVLLTYLNSLHSTNESFKEIKNLFISPIINTKICEKICEKNSINYYPTLTNNDDLKKLSENSAYFSENYKLYFENKLINIPDSMISLSIIADMLNYYKTQNNNLSTIYENLAKTTEEFILNEVHIAVDESNLEAFETKLFSQKEIAGFIPNKVVDLRNFEDINEKYIAHFVVNETTSIFVKYAYEFNKIIIYVNEVNKSKHLIFKKIKRFFKDFLVGYDTYIMKDISNSVTIEINNEMKNENETNKD